MKLAMIHYVTPGIHTFPLVTKMLPYILLPAHQTYQNLLATAINKE